MNNDYLVSLLTPGSQLPKTVGSSECVFLWQIYKHEDYYGGRGGVLLESLRRGARWQKVGTSALLPVPREGKCAEGSPPVIYSARPLWNPQSQDCPAAGLLNSWGVLRKWQTLRQHGSPAPLAASPRILPDPKLYPLHNRVRAIEMAQWVQRQFATKKWKPLG